MKVIALLSGGMDSGVATALAIKVFGKIDYSIAIDYGQSHKAEIETSRQLALHYKIPWRMLHIPIPKGGLAMAHPKDIVREAPTNRISPTYVPQRNLLLISIAASYLEYLLTKEDEEGIIVIGVHRTDWSPHHPIYPDCSYSFISALQTAINIGSRFVYEGNGIIKIFAPFVNKTKADIVQTGMELHFPFDKTVTCYRGNPPCINCPSCRARYEAFKEAGYKDPLLTKYHLWDKAEEKWGSK
ncbi:MAG: 7-cyano-7-deazaguanine synthase [Chloroflexi bacterium]|nr:MAG: 7-cyano-7-deazaguanine synthase [Chloroflexota bacterium]